MDTTAILATVSAIIKVAVDVGPSVIDGVEKAQPFAQEIYGIFTGQNATQDTLDAALARVMALSDQLQAPLPPDTADNG